MADSKTAGGAFYANLGKIYGGYAGGFIVFTLILAVLEQMGAVATDAIPALTEAQKDADPTVKQNATRALKKVKGR